MGMDNGMAAREIRKAYATYRTLPGTNQYMMISEVHNRTDLTPESMLAGIRFLMRESNFLVIPESNQKALTAEERAAAVVIGNQHRHMIAWY